MKKFYSVRAFFLAIFIIACTPQVTVTSEVTVTLTLRPTDTPSPTATAIPSPTPVEELVSYPICSVVEQTYKDCAFDLEKDIFSGRVDSWLERMKTPFNWDKVANIPLVYMDGWGRIQYSPNTAPNFEIPGSEQQHKDTVAGYISFEFEGKVYDYIFVPLEFVNPKTKESYWVKTVISIHNREGKLANDASENWVMTNWDEMRYLPIFTKFTRVCMQNRK